MARHLVDPTSMHRYTDETERVARAALGYARDRLRLHPVPLDGPRTAEELTEAAGATITEDGLGGEAAMRLFADVLAPAIISIDNPRFLAFIPAALVVQDNVRRKVLVNRAQPVGNPGTHARLSHQDAAGIPFQVRQRVIVRRTFRGMNKGQVVDDGRQVRENFRHPGARLPVLLELERTHHQRPGVALTHDDVAVAFERRCGDPKCFELWGTGIFRARECVGQSFTRHDIK
jgi:hypothetical protein